MKHVCYLNINLEQESSTTLKMVNQFTHVVNVNEVLDLVNKYIRYRNLLTIY